MKNFLALSLLLLFAAPSFSQPDCKEYKKGKFRYVDMPSAWFVIDGNKHTEYIENGKYIIESSLKWNSDCSYTTVLKKSTLPDFPYKPGDAMTVTFVKTEEGIIYFEAELKGEKSEGKIRKVE
jgi:hypothetical protein